MAATRFEPAAGLDAAVARLVAARVHAISQDVAEAARRLAPGTKTWQARTDGQVRKEHRDAHGQVVPTNLRFVLDSSLYDQQHYGAGPRQQLRFPRDPDGTPGQTINCRCEVLNDPTGLARGIRVEPVRVAGTRVLGRVVSGGPRVAEAEFGTDQDPAARYMGRAARQVATRGRL
jgi:hypothetical protein